MSDDPLTVANSGAMAVDWTRRRGYYITNATVVSTGNTSWERSGIAVVAIDTMQVIRELPLKQLFPELFPAVPIGEPPVVPDKRVITGVACISGDDFWVSTQDSAGLDISPSSLHRINANTFKLTKSFVSEDPLIETYTSKKHFSSVRHLNATSAVDTGTGTVVRAIIACLWNGEYVVFDGDWMVPTSGFHAREGDSGPEIIDAPGVSTPGFKLLFDGHLAGGFGEFCSVIGKPGGNPEVWFTPVGAIVGTGAAIIHRATIRTRLIPVDLPIGGPPVGVIAPVIEVILSGSDFEADLVLSDEFFGFSGGSDFVSVLQPTSDTFDNSLMMCLSASYPDASWLHRRVKLNRDGSLVWSTIEEGSAEVAANNEFYFFCRPGPSARSGGSFWGYLTAGGFRCVSTGTGILVWRQPTNDIEQFLSDFVTWDGRSNSVIGVYANAGVPE